MSSSADNNAPDIIVSDDGTVIITTSVDKHAYNIGDVLPDGWIAGPVVNSKHIDIEPNSTAVKGLRKFCDWQRRADKYKEMGQPEARLPDMTELDAIYNHIVKAGRNKNAGFITFGNLPGSIYCTSEKNEKEVHVMHFDSGLKEWGPRDRALLLGRCIRNRPDEFTLS